MLVLVLALGIDTGSACDVHAGQERSIPRPRLFHCVRGLSDRRVSRSGRRVPLGGGGGGRLLAIGGGDPGLRIGAARMCRELLWLWLWLWL